MTKRLLVTIAIVVSLFVLTASTTLAIRHRLRHPSCTTIIVSRQEIPPNTALGPLVEAGAFDSRCIPNEQIVNGAATDTDELLGQTTAQTIYPNEQVTVMRLQGSA